MPTQQPALPNARLTARPIPPDAPVTNTERGCAMVAEVSDPTLELVVMTGDYRKGSRGRQVENETARGLRLLLPSGVLWYRLTQPPESAGILETPVKRLHMIVGLVLVLAGMALPGFSLAGDDVNAIGQSSDYFPDTVGSHWEYHGQITEGPLQTIDHKFFTNVSTVVGTRTLRGMTVTVFHDTNPGNHGPSDSFYRRDVVGIVYHGSEPGTPLEKQLIPYQIVRFPIKISSTIQQFDKKGLDFGTDMDRDGVNEKVDAQGTSTVAGLETITVQAGTFKDAVKVEAYMRMRIHLSGTPRTVTGTDVMTAWFAKGVGLVKYVERQELSPLEDRGIITEIMEELDSYEVKPSKASLGRREAPAEGLFADHSSNHKLHEVVFASRLRSHP